MDPLITGALMRAVLVSLLLVLAACGDNSASSDAAGDDTPGPDGPPGPDAPPGDAPSRAVIVAGDFATTGILSTLDIPERTMTPGAVDGVAGTDPVIRHIGDELFVINRFGGNNVTIITDDTLGLVDQIGTGAGSNPQDVAMVGDKLYVAALGEDGVIVFDRANANARTEISLASLDAADGLPDCVSVYAVDTRVFVACGILDNFVPQGPGVVAVIDTTTDTVVDSFAIAAENPFSMFARAPVTSFYGGDLVIGTVPSFSDFTTGCLARVSVGAVPAANGCAATNLELGGYVNHVEASPDGGLLWLAVAGYTPTFDPFGMLKGIDLVTGALWEWPVSTTDEVIVDLAVCPGPLPGGVVVASDVGAVKGVRVYENAVEITTAPMPIGLPPANGGNVVCYPR
jgi:hypothetical protein